MKKRKPFSGFYIQGMGCISPQHTFDQTIFLPKLKEVQGNKLFVQDADYSSFFDAASLRRLNRLVKFGTAAGLIALRDAAVKSPAAISTGTGLGLLETSEKFLKSFLENNEAAVGPTAFIQSTHNTVSSNIALITGCHEHNYTFSQKGFSFESTLFDAEVLLSEGCKNVLAGAYEEISDIGYAVQSYHGDFRTDATSNLRLLNDRKNGTIAGEGAAFFLLSAKRGQNTYARISDIACIYKPLNDRQWMDVIIEFLGAHQLSPEDIDVLVSGDSGDLRIESSFQVLYNSVFAESSIVPFKQLSGEYMTASSFALWLSAMVIRHQQIPDGVALRLCSRPLNKVLICNKYEDYYTLILLEE
jgi:3-oxoacyl-[acyl-carrier-protein] synthase II